MVSFYVASLFTNIPLDGTVHIIFNGLFKEADTISLNNCSFNRSQFKKLLEFAVKDNHFIFNNELYEQKDGVAMGSPLRPLFANIFMCDLEQNFLSKCPLQCEPFLYRRYVDDTFCIFQNKVQAENFLLYFNQQHHTISFTHEFEANNSLPFLDVLIMHTDNSFSSNLYRKKTFTGLHTNFDSLSPM